MLSVLASSDQVLSCYYCKAKSIDTFDKVLLTLFYYYLRKWVILYQNQFYPSSSFFEDGDKVCVDGHEIKKNEDIKLYAFHKPINTMTTARDPLGRKTIYDVLDKKYKNLKYIGRLDFKTTGLFGVFKCNNRI